MRTYIVFDLEWNQSPEGKANSIRRMPFEIIEIGAVKMDSDFQIISRFHRLITPQVYTELHYVISEVTHMDIEKLKSEGAPFAEVIRDFIQWCGTDYWFCTWGAMDLMELQRNMEFYGVEIPFERPLYYYDVQKLYGIAEKDGKEKVSLDHAVEELGIEQSRPFHQALDDAWYTGLVLKHMNFDIWQPYISMDYYWVPTAKEEQVTLRFPTYFKFVSRTFDTKEDALADKDVSHVVCPLCRRMLRKKLRWFSLNQKQYFSLGVCPVHGYVRGKIRMKKAENGKFYVVKTMKATDEAGSRGVFLKKEEQRKKRHERSDLKKVKRMLTPPATGIRRQSP